MRKAENLLRTTSPKSKASQLFPANCSPNSKTASTLANEVQLLRRWGWSKDRLQDSPTMNIAILISVSKYTDSRNDLPACANDFALIDSILTHSGKFTEVLRLETDTTSSHVKSELARFVKEQKGKNIDELFFFYTGHGEIHLDDFYFVLSDYDEDRRQQTALSNAELDRRNRWLRTMKFCQIL